MIMNLAVQACEHVMSYHVRYDIDVDARRVCVPRINGKCYSKRIWD